MANRTYTRHLLTIWMLMVIIFNLCGCGTSTKEVVIFAAASLTESFSEIERTYESLHPEVDIVINYAGSQMLYNQIVSGTEPAMFFSANEKYVDQMLEPMGMSETDKTNFAKNQIVFLVNDDLHVEDFVGLLTIFEDSPAGISVILAHEDVPVGAYSKEIWDRFLLDTNHQKAYDNFFEAVVSYEQDVKSVLTKVKMGEADIGMVYRSDAMVGDLDGIQIVEIPENYAKTALYYALLLKEDTLEMAVYDYITAGEGQDILVNFGLN